MKNPESRPIRAVLLALALTVSACGGGSTSVSGSTAGDNETDNGDSTANEAPVASAGAARTVDEQQTVTLSGSGSSDPDGTLVSYQWHQMSGPSVTLSTPGSVDTSFDAPELTQESSLEFKLTVTDDDNATDADSVVITVAPVNNAPTAWAGPDQTVNGSTPVTLTGEAGDDDGELASVSWTQVSGTAVTLNNADQTSANFQAPSTTQAQELEFEFTATDQEGASSSDRVTITVVHDQAPALDIDFPPVSGAYAGADLDTFGRVAAEGSADIARIEIKADGSVTTIDAADINNGRWRLSDLALPDGVAEYRIRYEAFDSEGRSRVVRADLQKDDSEVGTGPSWQRSRTVALDSAGETAWVTMYFRDTDDFRLIPVDLRTGRRGQAITRFEDAGQGPVIESVVDLVPDEADGRFYLTCMVNQPGIYSVAMDSGNRTLVSGDSRGSGAALTTPVGLVRGPGDTLLVANYPKDNGNPAVVSVDPATGDRTLLADDTTSSEPLQKPLYLARDAGNSRLFMSSYRKTDPPLLDLDLASDPVTSAILSANSSHSGPDLDSSNSGLALDTVNNRLFFMDSVNDRLIAVDTASGERSLVADNVTGAGDQPLSRSDIAWAGSARVLYAVGGVDGSSADALFAIDPQSGDKVVVSR